MSNKTASKLRKRSKRKTLNLEDVRNIIDAPLRFLPGKRGRPPINRPTYEKPEDNCTSQKSENISDTSDDEDEEIAECVPNGCKVIQCCICDATMSKIYELRQHMEQHACVENYANDGMHLEAAAIYEVLNPYRRGIEANVIRDFVVGEIQQKRTSQFYAILSEAGMELHISDSETDSGAGTADEADATNAAAKKRLIPHNTYKCSLCAASFTRRYEALFHQRTAHAHEPLPLECDYCGRTYSGVQLLIHHLKTRCESDEHPVSCMERFQQYLLKVNLQQFERLAQARKDLKRHRLNTANKVYACSACDKTFLRSEHLTRHKAVHLPEEQKLQCPVCGRKFNRKDNLRSHMKIHLEDAERDNNRDQSLILCQICGHCFYSKSNYVVHMRRRHTGDKPYVCDVCGKGFVKSTDLKSHKVTHSGERKFECQICKKVFARSSVLSKHMRVHSGPYHCTYCNDSFQRPNELTRHLRYHTEEQTCHNKTTLKQEDDVNAAMQQASAQPKAPLAEEVKLVTAQHAAPPLELWQQAQNAYNNWS